MKFKPLDKKGEEIPYFRAPGKVLFNAECIFVEYHDILRCPWFTVMRILQYEPMLKGFIDFGEIDPRDMAAQMEWYVNRPTKNFLNALPTNPNIPNVEAWKDDMIRQVEQTLFTNDIVTKTLLLSPSKVVATALADKAVKRLIVWDEMGLEGIERDVHRIFAGIDGPNISTCTGPIREAIKLVPDDSTYFISDITIIDDLVAENKLDLSSIILGEYGYNYKPGTHDLLVDVVELAKKHPFKFNQVSTITIGNDPKGRNPTGVE